MSRLFCDGAKMTDFWSREPQVLAYIVIWPWQVLMKGSIFQLSFASLVKVEVRIVQKTPKLSYVQWGKITSFHSLEKELIVSFYDSLNQIFIVVSASVFQYSQTVLSLFVRRNGSNGNFVFAFAIQSKEIVFCAFLSGRRLWLPECLNSSFPFPFFSWTRSALPTLLQCKSMEDWNARWTFYEKLVHNCLSGVCVPPSYL